MVVLLRYQVYSNLMCSCASMQKPASSERIDMYITEWSC